MTTYRLHDITFASSLDLPELTPADGTPSMAIESGTLPPAGERWNDPWQREPRGPWVRVQAAEGYRIRYEGQVDFHVSRDTTRIVVDVLDCPPAAVRHFLLDQVLPLVLSLSATVLHASAVVVGGELVAFTGPCGRGKSTIAASFAERGHAVAADDALVLRQQEDVVAGQPAYPGLRLWPDAGGVFAAHVDTLAVSESSMKRRFAATAPFDLAARRVAAIYSLGDGTAGAFDARPMSARETAMLLIAQGFRLEQRDPAALAREMDRACTLAACVRAFEVDYPRDFASRGTLVDQIVRHVREQAGVQPCCS